MVWVLFGLVIYSIADATLAKIGFGLGIGTIGPVILKNHQSICGLLELLLIEEDQSATYLNYRPAVCRCLQPEFC